MLAQSKFEGADMLLHLDCGAGISGSATLAALAHMGVDYAPLTRALSRVGVLCGFEVADALGPGGPGWRGHTLAKKGTAALLPA